jgi:hypothetical protein
MNFSAAAPDRGFTSVSCKRSGLLRITAHWIYQILAQMKPSVRAATGLRSTLCFSEGSHTHS